MKIYIAGKITGDENYKSKFQKAADKLKNEGHSVMIPSILPSGFEHFEYMKICYAMIDVCVVVLFLSDWRDRLGAIMEHDYCLKTEKHIIYD